MRKAVIWTAAGLVATALGLSAARAEIRVSASIAPIHSLAARVMQGVGAPDLIVRPGASPHGYAMKPSEAAALEAADVVFWVGEELEPWLEHPLETLAGDAKVVALEEAPGLVKLELREGGVWAPHHHDHGDAHEHGDHDEDEHGDADHDEEHEHHDEAAHHDEDEHHGEADHHDEDEHHEAGHHDDEHEGEEHAEGEGGHHHDEHEHDPHVWLDPVNAKAMIAAIAQALSEADPENAKLYNANAKAAQGELDALIEETKAALAPVKEQPFIVQHDAYHYFEARFGLNGVGSIALSDAQAPGPARLREVSAAVVERGAVCVFTEPQFSTKLAGTVIEGSDAKTATLDPLGADITPGPALYPSLIRNLAASLAGCLAP